MARMNAEDVLAALAAHAAQADFRRPDPLVLAAAARKRGSKTPRNWRAVRDPETGKIDVAASWPALRTAQGRDARRTPRSQIHELAAYAIIGMPIRSWQAIKVAIGVPGDARDELVRVLLEQAKRSQKRDRFWPESVIRQKLVSGHKAATDYTEDLVELAILQLENPTLFATQWQLARWFGLSDRWWREVMSRPWDVVAGKLWSWYDAGIDHIERKIGAKR